MARKNNPAQTIENIIDTSAKLFFEKSYDQTSMQDIVTALSMSKGAIFYHFSSKEAIFNAVMERQFEQLAASIHQKLTEVNELSAKEKLRSLLKWNLTEVSIKEATTLITSVLENSQIVLATTQQIILKLAPKIGKLMRDGLADGSITTDFPEECAEVFLLLFNFWCDPNIFYGNSSKIHSRFKFSQQLMRQAGADIIDEEIMELVDVFIKKKQ